MRQKYWGKNVGEKNWGQYARAKTLGKNSAKRERNRPEVDGHVTCRSCDLLNQYIQSQISCNFWLERLGEWGTHWRGWVSGELVRDVPSKFPCKCPFQVPLQVPLSICVCLFVKLIVCLFQNRFSTSCLLFNPVLSLQATFNLTTYI